MNNLNFAKVEEELELSYAHKAIEQNPLSFPVKYKKTRAVPVKTFPFKTHYLVNKKNKTIAILSIS